MLNKKQMILPIISNAGIFDSNVKFKNIIKTPPRSITQFELELYTENGGIALINENEYPIKKGGLLCSKPGEMRSSILHFKCYYIYLDINDSSFFELLNQIPSMIEVTDFSKVVNLFNDIMHLFNSPTQGSDILISAKLLELLYNIKNDSIIDKRQNLLPSRINNKIIIDSIKFINENFQNSIALKDIARSVNLSPIYFHKIFTTLTDKTPHKFLLETRIARAKNLLLTTNYSTTTIASLCGFTSQSYFIQQFKNQTGETPGRYRKRLFTKDRL